MNLRLALLAAVALCASAPPAWFPGAEWLVFVGWAAFYALATREGNLRVKRFAYAIGVVHMLWFSFSLVWVFPPAYAGIGLVGGLYYVIAAVWTRSLMLWGLPGALSFGLAVAGAHWLRANFVEIQYPHVQPIHCLYEWWLLLGPLGFGGEVLGNLLVVVCAGGAVDLYRAWRVGEPGFRRSLVVFVGTTGLWLATAVGNLSFPSEVDHVDVLLVEPRLRPADLHGRDWPDIVRDRVIRPTAARAGAGVADAPELVLWPESVAVHRVTGTPSQPRVEIPPGFRLGKGVRLLQGAALVTDRKRRVARVLALLVDEQGRYLGHQEKRRAVPGGEHAPFLGWLPRSWSDAIREAFEAGLGVPLPEIEAGDPRPLLETGSGVVFGAMVCFDNCFPEVTEDLVARGARFVVVISNENWYLGGAELHQMAAMTACRAVECRVPVVRATMDGPTVVYDPLGSPVAGLPYPDSDYSGPRFLRHDLALPRDAVPALPWLRAPLEWMVLLALLAGIPPLLGFGGRLKRSSSASGGGDPPPNADSQGTRTVLDE